MLKGVPDLRKRLGEDAAPLELRPGALHSITYSPAGALSYNDAAIAQVRTQLLGDADKIGNVGPGQLTELLEGARTDKSRLARVLRLSPLLINPQGDLAERIRALTPEELQELYLGGRFQQVADQVASVGSKPGNGQIKQAFETVRNGFVAKDVRKAVTRVGGAVETLSLEEAPALVALYRGCFASDCSIKSVPYYALHKKVKIHLIRKSADPRSAPAGYAVTTTVEHDGREIPYVVTVNGPTLSAEDGRQVIGMIARQAGSPEVILPDFAIEGNHFLVNQDRMVLAMSFEGARDVQVDLPSGWKILDQYAEANKPRGYKVYYQESQLQKAKLVRLPENKLLLGEKTAAPAQLYAKPEDAAAIPLRDRAIVASQNFSTRSKQEVKDEVLRALGVTEAQAEAARAFLEASEDAPIDARRFLTLQREIGLELKDIEKLEKFTRAQSLGTIHAQKPDLMSPERWEQVLKAANQQLDKSLLEFEGIRAMQERDRLFKRLLDAKLKLPFQYWADTMPDLVKEARRIEWSTSDAYSDLRRKLRDVVDRLQPGDARSRKILDAIASLKEEGAPPLLRQEIQELVHSRNEIFVHPMIRCAPLDVVKAALPALRR